MLLVTDFERGGTPLRIARLARRLSAAGWEVWAGCLAAPGPVSMELEAAGVRTFACGAEDARDVLALARLSAHVRRVRPDLIHSTLVHANVAARMVGLRRRVPVVASTATIEVERRWHILLERATAGIERAHIVHSRALAEHVVRAFGLPRRRVYVVPPSLDPWPHTLERSAARAALKLPDTTFVVAWAGRFDVVKRLEVVVRCAELLSDAPTRFLLLGDGPERARIEGLLRSGRGAGVVELLGWQTDVGAILSAADAFLFPSRTEGLPNALLEAMACGLPIVASDIPAARELSGAGDCIRLVAGDKPAAFAAALRQLRDNANERQALGQRAAQWARDHLDPQATLAAVVRVYEEVLRRRPQA